MVKDMSTMTPVWVNGVIEAARSGTSMGSASYRINADLVELYERQR